MNVVFGISVVLVVAAITIASMLLVRRRAPEGSYFTDGDRASGVFGVLATGFSVLLGFIIFLAFSSYDESRSGAETEATIVAQQVQTAQFLPGEAGQQLTGELACYARSVAGAEWEAVDDGTLGDQVNPWGAEMYRTIKQVDPQTATEQSAYDRWMDQTADREQARVDRVHGAEGMIPAPLWLVLLVICGVIFAYMLFFADRAEGAVTQGMLMGSVTVVITLLMLLLVFFDHPHGGGVGRLEPTAMERTIRLIDIQAEVAGVEISATVRRGRQCQLTIPTDDGRTWQELLVTVLLVVAALGTSWSSYQATRWNGEQAAAAGRTNAIRIEAARAQGLSQSQTQVDVATFIAWADADRSGEDEVADFFVDRFRDEFRPAYDAWMATKPLTSPAAPPTPFAMDEYQVAARDEAARLDTAAEASAAEVRLDIQRSSNYVLTVVLYAVVLFFAGMSTRLSNRRLRWVMTLAGCAALIVALGWIATFPVSLAV